MFERIPCDKLDDGACCCDYDQGRAGPCSGVRNRAARLAYLRSEQQLIEDEIAMLTMGHKPHNRTQRRASRRTRS